MYLPANPSAQDRDGYLFPLDGIPAADAAAARGRIEVAERATGKSGNGLFTNAHVTYDWCHSPSGISTVPSLLTPYRRRHAYVAMCSRIVTGCHCIGSTRWRSHQRCWTWRPT